LSEVAKWPVHWWTPWAPPQGANFALSLVLMEPLASTAIIIVIISKFMISSFLCF